MKERSHLGAMLQGIAASLLAHAAVLGGAYAYVHYLPRAPVRQVLVAKLVRLGPSKNEQQLPEKEQALTLAPAPVPPPTAAPPPDAPKVPPPAASVPTSAPPPVAARPPAPVHSAPAGAADRRNVRAALARLKQRSHGQPTGSEGGDVDQAEAGDAYAAELYRCVKRNYVIEGIEAARVVGRKAVVLVHVQADGRIVRHRVTASSGLAAFDRSVDRAVQRCGRISPPPQALATSLRREGLEIEFVP